MMLVFQRRNEPFLTEVLTGKASDVLFEAVVGA
jgi:hypothetical protein